MEASRCLAPRPALDSAELSIIFRGGFWGSAALKAGPAGTLQLKRYISGLTPPIIIDNEPRIANA